MMSEKIDVRETREIAHFHHRIEVQIVVISWRQTLDELLVHWWKQRQSL